MKPYEVQKNYLKAVGKGILKVMSKMGISTYQSYCGAQIFDAVGLSQRFVEKCFTGTASTIEGAGFEEIAARSGAAASATPTARTRCTTECWMPAATTRSACAARIMRGRRNRSAKLQHAARGNSLRRVHARSPASSTTRARGC